MSPKSLLCSRGRRTLRSLAICSAGLLLAGLSGCRSIRQEWDVPTGPAFRPTNYTGVAALPASVRRVAVLPLHSSSWEAVDVAPIETAFLAELAKFGRFEIVSVPRAEMHDRFGADSYDSSDAIPADFLAQIRATYGADAVLFQDLTHYTPYQPVAIGVRAKLATAADGRALWSFDANFDAAQPGVAVAAREYHHENSRRAYPVEDSSAIMQSPARFAKYVAHTVFGTLPPRQAR